MFSTSISSEVMKGFDFSMRTSSGDKIDLSMYTKEHT